MLLSVELMGVEGKQVHLKAGFIILEFKTKKPKLRLMDQVSREQK